jgi:nitrite reductase/ring-hydroxylating ferredoxin subunit
VSPATLGSRELILVSTTRFVRVADAVCPHRGAHLGVGGRCEGDTIVCPFHGHRITIGDGADATFRVREYEAVTLGGLVCVRLSSAHDNGFAAMLTELDRDHFFLSGFSMPIRAPAELVIENAFDVAHFGPVHGIRTEPRFRIRPSQTGELAVEGTFWVPPSPWQRRRPGEGARPVPFVARAYSPGLVLSELGGEHPYKVITAATPVANGTCIVRLTVAIPADADGAPPDSALCQYLLEQSRAGIEKDRLVWEHLAPFRRERHTPGDGAVEAFQAFCARFDARASQ